MEKFNPASRSGRIGTSKIVNRYRAEDSPCRSFTDHVAPLPLIMFRQLYTVRAPSQAALDQKPYIWPKVTVHKWSLEIGLKNIQAAAYNGARTVFLECIFKVFDEESQDMRAVGRFEYPGVPAVFGRHMYISRPPWFRQG